MNQFLVISYSNVKIYKYLTIYFTMKNRYRYYIITNIDEHCVILEPYYQIRIGIFVIFIMYFLFLLLF